MTNDFVKIYLKTPFLTLGQLLKLKNLIFTGGEAKTFLKTHEIKVNENLENKRGRKLYSGDKVVIDSKYNFLITNEN